MFFSALGRIAPAQQGGGRTREARGQGDPSKGNVIFFWIDQSPFSDYGPIRLPNQGTPCQRRYVDRGQDGVEEESGTERSPRVRSLVLKIMGVSGASFTALLSAADQIDKWLPGPVGAWLLCGPIISGWWAYEMFRK